MTYTSIEIDLDRATSTEWKAFLNKIEKRFSQAELAREQKAAAREDEPEIDLNEEATSLSEAYLNLYHEYLSQYGIIGTD